MLGISSVVKVFGVRIGDFSVSILCRNIGDGYSWAFTGVYGLCDQPDFVRISKELLRVSSDWHVLWCLGGDFKAVCFALEKLGASRLSL